MNSAIYLSICLYVLYIKMMMAFIQPIHVGMEYKKCHLLHSCIKWIKYIHYNLFDIFDWLFLFLSRFFSHFFVLKPKICNVCIKYTSLLWISAYCIQYTYCLHGELKRTLLLLLIIVDYSIKFTFLNLFVRLYAGICSQFGWIDRNFNWKRWTWRLTMRNIFWKI